MTLDLNRRFSIWDEKDPDAPRRLALRGLVSDGTNWEALRAHRRVIVLAEAGSGKSEELRAQARALSAQGLFAFHAALEEVAREGLDQALELELERLEAWRESSEPGYFFIDSIDETKLDGIRLESALKKIAAGIRAAPRRAHIILSGRISDWEYRADLARLKDILPVPADPKLPPPPDSTALMSALRGTRTRSKDVSAPAEEPIVVLMEPLDEDRVRRFASGKGVTDPDPFLRAIDQGDLWSLAKRPLDLEWMVNYWHGHGHLGPLTVMLEASLLERSQESNPQYRLNDPLSADKVSSALKRVGAALVFGHADKIVIPDTAVELSPSVDGLRLDRMLPDWGAEEWPRLLRRAVFDPATFGRVRLHNDNEGLVRAYLAAKWVKSRREQGAPARAVLDLLFCDTYGFDLVRTSLRSTAAWLSLWDADVAREVIAREPGLLLVEGDPGSLSEVTRAGVLKRIFAEMASTGERLGYVPEETLRRFATGPLDAAMRALWNEFVSIKDCRVLMLRIMALGVLKGCGDVAASAAFGSYPDDMSCIMGGRALLAIGDAAEMQRYGNYIREHAAELSPLILWEAIDGLFPQILSVPDFFGLVSHMSEKAINEAMGLDYYGRRCIKRLSKRVDLENFLNRLTQLSIAAAVDEEESDAEDHSRLKLLAAAAIALMTRVGHEEAPEVAMNVALRLTDSQRYRKLNEQTRELLNLLKVSPRRRRLAFWRAAKAFTNHRLSRGAALDVWAMRLLGWPAGLQIEDLPWILADALNPSTPEHAALAVDAAMTVWKDHGQTDALMQRIRQATDKIPELAAVVDRFLAPRPPSPAQLEHDEEMARIQAQQAEREADVQTSWTTFIDDLKRDPNQLLDLPPPSKESVDARLYHLWELLSGLDGQSHYAIDNVRLLEPLVGAAVTETFSSALIAFWRQWQPTLESDRASDQRNLINRVDCMAICAISVEAAANTQWLDALNSSQARRAAQFATLELNGFPSWFESLATTWPAEVGEVLLTEVLAELGRPSPQPHAGSLQDIENGPVKIAQTVAPGLFLALKVREDLPAAMLGPVLRIVARGLDAETQEFLPFLLERAREAGSVETRALYLAPAFYRDPETAYEALSQQLGDLEPEDQAELVATLFPSLFGDDWRDRNHEAPLLPLPVIERLLAIAFRYIRTDDDITHADGQVFSPGVRDAAQAARGALFKLLRSIPGPATIAALRRLETNEDMPFVKLNLEQWCLERAAADSELAPWPAEEAAALESEFDAIPRTAAELQAVALRRLQDVDHDLHHGDSALGDVFKSLPDENAVQRWIGQEFRIRRVRAYTVEREPHVADEKEPDIRLQSPEANASLPIEIKIAESWSLKELEKGLVVQLCGRYLRQQHDKYGVYLIAHKEPRPLGWHSENGTLLSFPDVITHLQLIADRLARDDSNGPRISIFVIDVTDMG